MKNLSALAALLVLLVVTPTSPIAAEPRVSAPAGSLSESALIGSWAVDITRLPIPPQARPKSVTITFGDSGDGGWITHVDIVDAGGAQSHTVGTATLNGKPAPVAGSAEADTAAVKMPVPNVLVLSLGRGGIPASTRVYAVAADGKTMIETVVYFWDHDQPIPAMRTNYFTRIPSSSAK
jgi:hypothetical protein